MAKSPAPQPFARPCTPFSPARVDNSLVRALVPARDSRRGVPSRRPWLAHALFPRDTRPRRSQQTSRHGAEAAGSFGGAGRGPMPPSSTAAPSCAPPRRFLRGVQATPGSRTSVRLGVPVSAAARGLVSAAADAPSPLDCPRGSLGCQATFWPPVGSATRSNGRCVLPYQLAPQGAHEGRHRRRGTLPVPLMPATPQPPLGGSAER